MSLKDVKLELDEIELQQQGLEKQGVRLEQLIRSKCESGSQISGKYICCTRISVLRKEKIIPMNNPI